MEFNIPKEVSRVTEALEKADFEAYLVGGCVRDILLGKTPKDWDITTNARPEQIEELFEETFYNNDFGTVGIVQKTDDPSLKVIEVTPYRTETTYSDARRPDSVEYSDSLEEDLQRRDFTMNAIAYNVSRETLTDPYKGQEDIVKRTIRAVGDPVERFEEDALRMLRAVRLSAELHFKIEENTRKAIKKTASLLDKISVERIRDEFIRIVMSDEPMNGLLESQELGILQYFAPDLEKAMGVTQNYAHKYDVFEHLLRTVQHSADKKFPLEVRLGALFHDISKPVSRRTPADKAQPTFYGHEVVGSRETKRLLTHLKFPKETIEKVTNLVRWHMFFSDPDEITLSAVRRMIRNVGEDNIWDLLNVRICDRIGSGRPKEQPFRFRKYKAMVEEALRDPLSVNMLKIDGKILMENGIKAGPEIGYILHALLEEVLEDPKKNTAEYLKNTALELHKMPIEELENLGKSGQKRIKEEEEAAIKAIRDKLWVD